jgi:two-component sensor histidine kinase
MGDPRSAGDGPGDLEQLISDPTGRAVLEAVMGSIPAIVMVVGAPDGKVLRISDYACTQFGAQRDLFEGRSLAELLAAVQPRDWAGRPFTPDEFPMTRALRGETVLDVPSEITTPAGALTFVSGCAAPIRDAQGRVIGAISAPVDVTGPRAAEAALREHAERQEALYRELTHRVKNHLNIVAGLVALEMRDPGVTAGDLAERIKGRLQTLAAVYDSMTKAEALGEVEALGFIENVVRPYPSPRVAVSVRVSPPDLALSSERAGPFGMLVNEAVCNSVKHAFPRRERGGRVQVSFDRRPDSTLRLEVDDDGVGGVRPEVGRLSHGLGLMRLHARQLKGEFEIGDRPGGGTRVCVTMPEA